MAVVHPLSRLISCAAYPASFDDDYDESGIFDAVEPKLARPLSIPGSPRSRTGMMTPGDFASLQEGREGLSTEDYIAWKLPYVLDMQAKTHKERLC